MREKLKWGFVPAPPGFAEARMNEYKDDPAYWVDILVHHRRGHMKDDRRCEEAVAELKRLGVVVIFEK
jgi:hypothetical protein